MTLPKRRGYTLRPRSQDKQRILTESSGGEFSQSQQKSVSPNSGNISADSAYFSPETSPTARTRNSTWLDSLRSALLRQRPHRKPNVTVPQGLCGSFTAPQTEEELDKFLSEVWTTDAAENEKQASSQYVRKVTELKAFVDRKLAEIAQREATHVSGLMYQDETTPLITADALCSDAALKSALLEVQIGYRFDELRFKMKQEVAQTILSLRAHYIDTGRRRRNLRPKTRKILTEWFERHLDHPYPTEQEKRHLALQCEITTEQVSTWFSNKRCRSKSLKKARGQKSKA